MAELIIKTEHFSKDFCMFDMILVKVYSNTLSMTLLLIIVSAFKC